MASQAISVRSRTRVAIAVLLLPLLLSLLGPIRADAATVVEHYHFHGSSVYAEALESDGCVITSTVLMSDRRTTWYGSLTMDTCTDPETVLQRVSGEVQPTIFRVSKNLGAAHVVATIPLVDYSTGESAGDFTVDEYFTGSGPAYTDSYSETSRIGGEYLMKIRSSGTYREATVTGTASFDYALIAKYNSAYLEITKQARG